MTALTPVLRDYLDRVVARAEMEQAQQSTNEGTKEKSPNGSKRQGSTKEMVRDHSSDQS